MKELSWWVKHLERVHSGFPKDENTSKAEQPVNTRRNDAAYSFPRANCPADGHEPAAIHPSPLCCKYCWE